MKTKVAILDFDEHYVRRLMGSFQMMYADKLELYVFSGTEQLYRSLYQTTYDVLLIDEKAEIDRERIPDRVGFAYLSEAVDIEEIRGIKAVCKYQRADLIYKEILALCQEFGEDRKFRTEGKDANIILFLSPQGGTGTSNIAAALALHKSREQKKVFYLNLETLGTADSYFQDEGTMNFSEVIYSLKSARNNFLLKLESLMKTDKSGVDFFSSCQNPWDMQELKDEELRKLLEGIAQVKAYDYIVIDISGDYNRRMKLLMEEYASRIVCVCDGSKIGLSKLERFCEMIKREETLEGKSILKNMALLYNRCREHRVILPETIRLEEIGIISEQIINESSDLIEQLAREEAVKHI